MLKTLLAFIFLGMVLLGCKSKGKEDTMVSKVADEISLADSNTETDVTFRVYDFKGLQPLLSESDGKTYVVNFWATWCKPCVEEMPYFERMYAEQQKNGVELIFVSLDMPTMWKSRLEPFVQERQLKGKVVILDDPKMNDWIPKVDPEWGGGIPATLIYNSQKRSFFERGFTYEELNEEIQKFL